MNWLLALLGFAGIMAVLSTVVTGAVEAIHKFLSLRRSGLQEMLRALHDAVLLDIEEGRRPRREVLRAQGRSKEASQFASDMTKSPAFGGGGRWWWPSNWGLNIAQRRFESLTPRQFAEQLAQTQFGQKLADEDPSKIRSVLARSMYEFDRYGVAQSQYFRRRAKVLSGVVAFAFVVFGNFNAISLYMHLSEDEGARNRVLAAFDGGDPAAVAAVAAQVQTQMEAALRPSADGQLPTEAQVRQSMTNIVTVRDVLLENVDGQTGLPIGMRYFPFCKVDAGAAPIDATRCQDDPPELAFDLLGQGVAMPAPLVRLANSPGEGVVWFLSMVASAGLLALGSPFWYQLFSRIAQTVGGAARAAAAEVAPEKVAEAGQSRAGRGPENPGLDALEHAFRIAAGIETAPGANRPRGARLGASSTSTVAPDAGQGASRNDAVKPPSRKVRKIQGDWSGGA